MADKESGSSEVAPAKVEVKKSWADVAEEESEAELKKLEELTVSDSKGVDPGLLEDPDDSQIKAFLEVKCRSSGKIRRFAQGTESSFALRIINSKLEIGDPLALCIAAVKEGEEPVIFGPSAPLSNYGDGWKLETLVNDGEDHTPMKETSFQKASKKQNNDIDYSWMVTYLGKVLLVFAFMFFIAGVYSYFLVVLPDLISSLGSYWEGSTTLVSS